MALDTMCIMLIDNIVYPGRKMDEHGFEFFIISGVTVNVINTIFFIF
jgi:hypothetical protein